MPKYKFCITYWYEGKYYTTHTKECTFEQAERAFNEDLNTFGKFELVSIIAEDQIILHRDVFALVCELMYSVHS